MQRRFVQPGQQLQILVVLLQVYLLLQIALFLEVLGLLAPGLRSQLFSEIMA